MTLHLRLFRPEHSRRHVFDTSSTVSQRDEYISFVLINYMKIERHQRKNIAELYLSNIFQVRWTYTNVASGCVAKTWCDFYPFWWREDLKHFYSKYINGQRKKFAIEDGWFSWKLKSIISRRSALKPGPCVDTSSSRPDIRSSHKSLSAERISKPIPATFKLWVAPANNPPTDIR